MDIQRKAFEESNNVNPDWSFKFDEELQQYIAVDFEMTSQVDEFNEHWDTFRAGWQAAKAQVVPETPKHKNGYYIRDLRNPIGNCMKFWYQCGYGTKHKNFFWCETLEEAKKYQGGCDWFEIWHAPYIDSLVEHTVDFQLADRNIGFVDLKAQEQGHE
ncbi:hypothetical protein A6M14_09490 [Acinetobacter sp. Ac_877]|uniref:hypothetical protein n=1 Tax=Acinetobacter portensis TaxID=1839785 RepID=UPI00128D2955|nr:hypothetical protein [Acinetobacter portensis]MPW41700.1 hypothetical protein [Acinetobacter portensis]